MNDSDVQPGNEPIPHLEGEAGPIHRHKGVRYWAERLLACNPAYLISALLLLYGLYRISTGPLFMPREIAQLDFNFSSLQLYEAALVGLAIFLWSRKIRYDSILLVVMENLFVFVPFLLVSQAGLIERRAIWIMCAVAAGLALLRGAAVRRFMTSLHWSWRLTAMGAIMLLVNAGLCVAYRLLHDSKVATHITWGAAYYTNELAWILLMPALAALAFLVPAPARDVENLAGENSQEVPGGVGGARTPPLPRALPLGIFALWLAATATHLYCLAYIYDFLLRRELIVPVIWISAWALRHHLPNFVSVGQTTRRLLLIPPLLVALAAFEPFSRPVFECLLFLNAAIYGKLWNRDRTNRIALHLSLLSLFALASDIPQYLASHAGTGLAGLDLRNIAIALCGYAMVCTLLSRNYRIGMLGAAFATTASILMQHETAGALHWAFEIGLAFLLIHSYRWNDASQARGKTIRYVSSFAWIIHACVWMRFGGEAWMACAVATPVLAGSLAFRLWEGVWRAPVLPLAAVVVVLSGPGNAGAGHVHTVPVGLLAILSSFVFLGLGTAAALARHRIPPERSAD